MQPNACTRRWGAKHLCHAVHALDVPHAACMQAFERMEVEAAIPLAQRVYCPHKDCSALLLRPEAGAEDDGGPEAASEGPATCPACSRAFCPRCNLPGWHKVRPRARHGHAGREAGACECACAGSSRRLSRQYCTVQCSAVRHYVMCTL